MNDNDLDTVFFSNANADAVSSKELFENGGLNPSLIKDYCYNSLKKNDGSDKTENLNDFINTNDESESKPNEDINEQIKSINECEKFVNDSKAFSSFERYTDLLEFNGVIDAVDYISKSFEATYYNIVDKKEMVSSFSFEDLLYDDDAQAIKVGTKFILIVGKKRKSIITNGKTVNGGKENFCRIYLREEKRTNPIEESLINENVKRWSMLFNK